MHRLRQLSHTAVRQRTSLFARGSRLQSSHHGPHKEYFQDPARFPTAAEIAGTPIRQDVPILPATEPTTRPTRPQIGPSRIVRFLRGTSLSVVFLSFGVVIGTSVVTWDYIQPPFPPGSDEEQDLMDDISDVIASHPLTNDLTEKGWRLDDARVPRRAGEEDIAVGDQHYLYETLGPTHGVASAIFRHPTEHCTVFAFFPCFGVEGWPDVVHGGMLSTLLIEALEQHCVVYAEEGLGFTCDAFPFNFNFSRPVRPGELYAIIMTPPTYSMIRVTGDDKNQSMPAIQANVTGIVMRVEGAPQLLSEAEVKQRGLPTSSSNGGEMSTHIAFDGRSGELCTTMSATVVLLPVTPIAGDGSASGSADAEKQLRGILQRLKEKRGQVSITRHPGADSFTPKSG